MNINHAWEPKSDYHRMFMCTFQNPRFHFDQKGEGKQGGTKYDE